MPLLEATLGTDRSGERHLVVATEVDGDDGKIEFPLDHVVLAARRVRARGAADLWVAGVDAAWQLAGGTSLGEHSLDEAARRATRALARFSTMTSPAVPINVSSSHSEGEWALEATTERSIPNFTIEEYHPQLIPAGSNAGYSMQQAGSVAVGDRLHVLGELDAYLIYILALRDDAWGRVVIGSVL